MVDTAQSLAAQQFYLGLVYQSVNQYADPSRQSPMGRSPQSYSPAPPPQPQIQQQPHIQNTPPPPQPQQQLPQPLPQLMQQPQQQQQQQSRMPINVIMEIKDYQNSNLKIVIIGINSRTTNVSNHSCR